MYARMHARDLMSTSLVTVLPETPVGAVAQMLAGHGISGMPVVDAEGRLLGLVTEGDLIRRLAAPQDRSQSWVRGLFAVPAEQAARYARTHGRRARDVMTTNLLTVEEDTPVERIASIIEERNIRRVPVVRDGKLVGIISRADLLRALLARPEEAAADTPDEQIRRELSARMREQPWVDTFLVFADVEDGVVTFHGFSRSENIRRALVVLAEGVPGVKAVHVETQAPLPYMLAAA